MDEVIDRKYQLLRRLDADDETSALYVASDLESGGVVCLRLWSLGPGTARLLADAQPDDQTIGTRELDPRLVQPHDWGIERNVVYLARPYVQGRSLPDLVEREGPLGIATAMDYAAQIAEAVAIAHAHGVTHGGLRPNRILIDEHGEVRLVGFAEASTSAEPEPRRSRTIHGFAPRSAGAPPDPEAAERERARQKDIYALGALAYYMLTMDDPLATPPFLRGRGHVPAFRTLRPSAQRSVTPALVDEAVALATTPSASGNLQTADVVAMHFRTAADSLHPHHWWSRWGLHQPASEPATEESARMSWWELARHQLADMQGHLAIAFLIVLAVVVFALTLGKLRPLTGGVATAAATASVEPAVQTPALVQVPQVVVETPTPSSTASPEPPPTEEAPSATATQVLPDLNATTTARLQQPRQGASQSRPAVAPVTSTTHVTPIRTATPRRGPTPTPHTTPRPPKP